MSLFKNKYVLLVLVALFWLIFDQVTKYAVVANLTSAPYGDSQCTGSFERFWSCPHPAARPPKVLLGPALSFHYVENNGAAFGIFTRLSDSVRRPLLLTIVILAIGLMIFMYLKSDPDKLIWRTCLAPIIGGAVGNWIDRFRLTYVIDFISNDFGFWPFHPWPIYNVADIAVTVGIAVILIDGFFFSKEEKAEKKPA